MDTPGWVTCHSHGRSSSDVNAPFVTSQRRRFFLNCLRTHFLKSWRNKGTPFWLWALSLTGERHKMMIEVISWVIFESCWTLKAVYIFAKLWFMGRQMSRFKRVTLQLGASAAVGCSSQLPTSSLVASERFSVDLYVALSSPAGVLVKKKKKNWVPLLCNAPAATRASTSYSAQPPQPHSIQRHTSLARARHTNGTKETGATIGRKRRTTLGISNSSSKALSWKRTQGLSVVR